MLLVACSPHNPFESLPFWWAYLLIYTTGQLLTNQERWKTLIQVFMFIPAKSAHILKKTNFFQRKNNINFLHSSHLALYPQKKFLNIYRQWFSEKRRTSDQFSFIIAFFFSILCEIFFSSFFLASSVFLILFLLSTFLTVVVFLRVSFCLFQLSELQLQWNYFSYLVADEATLTVVHGFNITFKI